MVGIVRREMKWYSRNNRGQWCFKEANVEAVEDLVSQAGRGQRSNRPSVKIAPHSPCHPSERGPA